MAKGESPATLRDIYTLFHVGAMSGLTDEQLLALFMARADRKASEAAFAGLMARHGAMVLGVCRRSLSDPDDVADAFQATFLVLVRKANTVRVEGSIGRWLYGVSRRVSVRAKMAAVRRSARETGEVELVAAPASDEARDDLRVVLDEEIGRLPEKYRAAVVLCDLGGLGHDEAARQMGCPVGTVKSRLSRAREKLRSRLIRRGIAPAAVAMSGGAATAAPPAALMEASVKAAMQYAAGPAEVVAASAAVINLTEGVLKAMFMNKLRMITLTVIASLALATGVGVVAQQAAAPAPRGEPSGDRAKQGAGLVKGADDTTRPRATPPDDPIQEEDGSFDRIESLRLDIEFLTKEVQTIERVIGEYSDNIIYGNYNKHTVTEGGFGGGRPRLDENQIDSGKERLKGLRKDYLLKSKELRQKQRQLDALQGREMRQGLDESPFGKRTGSDKKGVKEGRPVATQPASSDPPGISPDLEKRLSRLEQRLDQVLKALEDSKRERDR